MKENIILQTINNVRESKDLFELKSNILTHTIYFSLMFIISEVSVISYFYEWNTKFKTIFILSIFISILISFIFSTYYIKKTYNKRLDILALDSALNDINNYNERLPLNKNLSISKLSFVLNKYHNLNTVNNLNDLIVISKNGYEDEIYTIFEIRSKFLNFMQSNSISNKEFLSKYLLIDSTIWTVSFFISDYIPKEFDLSYKIPKYKSFGAVVPIIKSMDTFPSYQNNLKEITSIDIYDKIEKYYTNEIYQLDEIIFTLFGKDIEFKQSSQIYKEFGYLDVFEYFKKDDIFNDSKIISV